MEEEIDEIVFDLFELREEERKVIERDKWDYALIVVTLRKPSVFTEGFRNVTTIKNNYKISILIKNKKSLMKTNIEPLQPDSFYHIYNRGINGENIFKEERNYSFFLERYAHYVEPFAETYAYCLLKNHFHLLIRTRPESEIRKKLTNIHSEFTEQVNGIIQRKPALHVEKPIEWILGNSFSSLFKSYSQSINNTHNRTGRLFEQPFRRILVDTDDYFTELIYYIHRNPQNHGFVEDFKLYPYSSYHSHLSASLTRLKRNEVIDWFGNKEEFKKFHAGNQNLDNLDKFRIEFD